MQIRLTASPRDFIQAVLCLRVIAVAGQIAVIVVAFRWLHVVMPMQALGGVIGLLAVTALLSAVRLRASWPVTELEVTLQLFVDVGALAALLYMSGGYTNPEQPLVISLDNVVADDPTAINLISTDADITLHAVNLPILQSAESRVTVTGMPTQAVDPAKVVDCSWAFVDFPSPTSPAGTTWNP